MGICYSFIPSALAMQYTTVQRNHLEVHYNATLSLGGTKYSVIISLRPSDAYMLQWSNHHWFTEWLVAWSTPSHYLNHCLNIVNWTLRNKLQWNFIRNPCNFIQEYASIWKCRLPKVGYFILSLNILCDEQQHGWPKYYRAYHPITRWVRDNMDAISQTTFSTAFSWMKMFEFRFKFHWVFTNELILTNGSLWM